MQGLADTGSTLRPRELARIIKLVYERSGITLHEGKRELVIARLQKRLRARRDDPESSEFELDPEYLREVNEAYQHFFFHYNATPLLVIETSQFADELTDEILDDLVRQIKTMGQGTRYYVPRTK